MVRLYVDNSAIYGGKDVLKTESMFYIEFLLNKALIGMDIR